MGLQKEFKKKSEQFHVDEWEGTSWAKKGSYEGFYYNVLLLIGLYLKTN